MVVRFSARCCCLPPCGLFGFSVEVTSGYPCFYFGVIFLLVVLLALVAAFHLATLFLREQCFVVVIIAA